MSPTISRAPSFHTVAQVADQLGVSPKTIRRWIGREELRVHHLGRQLRISAEDLAAFLGQRRR
jgi:excisionase family DNA binding protein